MVIQSDGIGNLLRWASIRLHRAVDSNKHNAMAISVIRRVRAVQKGILVHCQSHDIFIAFFLDSNNAHIVIRNCRN